MIKINEGLMVGDLKDLILPLISIDEYNSKLSSNNEVIVVGFFANDKEPANDLNNFILKTPIEIVDSDVSPAPNEEGYYMVFVEIQRNKEFPTKLLNLVTNLKELTQNKKWQFISYGDEKLYDLSEKEIKQHININKPKLSETILKWLNNSYLYETSFDKSYLTLNKKTYKVVGFGKQDKVMESLKIANKMINLKENYKLNSLQLNLGNNYATNIIESYIVISSACDNNILVLNML